MVQMEAEQLSKQKHYVVWVGKAPGVYTSWADCQSQTNGYYNAKYKAYPTKEEAAAAYKDGWEKHWGKSGTKSGSSTKAQVASKQGTFQKKQAISKDVGEIDYNSISVDVGTNGNPGPTEYKGVDTQTGETLFAVGPIAKGTNNLGEFLAIVHALAYIKKTGIDKSIYSDSLIAMKWIKQKKVATTLARDESTKEIWELVDRATYWLNHNTYSTKIMKWQTKTWGEIKADYGRK